MSILSNLLFSQWKLCTVEGRKVVCLFLAFTDIQESMRAWAAEYRCLEEFPNPSGKTGPEAQILRVICFNTLLDYIVKHRTKRQMQVANFNRKCYLQKEKVSKRKEHSGVNYPDAASLGTAVS